MSGQPLVSVIMPAYNTAAYIAEAVDSVLEQDYPCLELIVIDDGSTDGTVDILRGYGSRLTLLQQRNQGAAVARNAGIQASSGEFIAFLDSDDCWAPGKLTAQVDYLQANPEVGIVYARWLRWFPGGDGRFPDAAELLAEEAARRPPNPKQAVPERSGWLYNRLLFTSLLHTITVVARRSLVEQVGLFNPDLKRGQDYDYWIRASREAPIHQLDQAFALYRLHGNGCAHKWPTVNYELEVVRQALDRWGPVGPQGERTSSSALRHRLSDACFSFGYHHYWEGDPRLAMRAFAGAALRKPVTLRAWAYLAMSAWKHTLRRGTESGRS